MADIPPPKSVEGWAQEPRLGPVDSRVLDEMMERQARRREEAASAQRQRALVAVLMLALGATALIVAVTAILGWAWGTGAGGMMFLIMGYMLGRDDTGTNERGQ